MRILGQNFKAMIESIAIKSSLFDAKSLNGKISNIGQVAARLVNRNLATLIFRVLLGFFPDLANCLIAYATLQSILNSLF